MTLINLSFGANQCMKKSMNSLYEQERLDKLYAKALEKKYFKLDLGVEPLILLVTYEGHYLLEKLSNYSKIASCKIETHAEKLMRRQIRNSKNVSITNYLFDENVKHADTKYEVMKAQVTVVTNAL